LDNVLNHCSLELAVLLKTTELAAIAPHNYLVYNTSQCKLPPPPTQKLAVFTSQHCIIKIAGMCKYLVFVSGPVYMIPARRDGMLTEIPLIIQILKSVYMILPLIPPTRDLSNRCRDPTAHLNEMKNSHINTSSRLGRKIPIIIYIIKHFIPARRDELFPFEHA
jgi:hypothetical protein